MLILMQLCNISESYIHIRPFKPKFLIEEVSTKMTDLLGEGGGETLWSCPQKQYFFIVFLKWLEYLQKYITGSLI